MVHELLSNNKFEEKYNGSDTYPYFHAAVAYGQLRVLDYLLESPHFDINSQDEDGTTALYIAAQCGRAEAVKVLLTHGARIDIKRKDIMSPLAVACREGHETVVKALMEAGAEVGFRER